MALTITNEGKNAILDGLDDYVNPSGYVQFESVNDTNYAKIPLAETAFDVASGGNMALDTASELINTSGTAGTVADLAFYTTNATKVMEFDVSTTTTTNYCNMSSNTLGAGDTVEITSCILNMDNN